MASKFIHRRLLFALAPGGVAKPAFWAPGSAVAITGVMEQKYRPLKAEYGVEAVQIRGSGGTPFSLFRRDRSMGFKMPF